MGEQGDGPTVGEQEAKPAVGEHRRRVLAVIAGGLVLAGLLGASLYLSGERTRRLKAEAVSINNRAPIVIDKDTTLVRAEAEPARIIFFYRQDTTPAQFSREKNQLLVSLADTYCGDRAGKPTYPATFDYSNGIEHLGTFTLKPSQCV
jgi:hypothetical protein